MIAIECKASKSPNLTRGFWNAIEDVQADETWVVVPISEAFPLKGNVWVLSLAEALKKMEGIQKGLFE